MNGRRIGLRLHARFAAGPRHCRAFTLIEIIVTLAVIAILAIVAIPSLLNSVRANRVDGIANQFVAMLTMARSEAMRQGASASVYVVSGSGGTNWGGGGWCVVSVAAGSNSAPSCTLPGAGVTVVQTVPALAAPASAYGTVAQLNYDNTGALVGFSGLAEADFIFCADGSTATSPTAAGVNVVASGRARVADVNAGNQPLHNDEITPSAGCNAP